MGPEIADLVDFQPGDTSKPPAKPQPRSSQLARPLTTIPYMPQLDGFRALAVTCVFMYHGGVAGATGGFLGVDAFFVLSGYLITRLLVSEWEASGSIALVAFWLRRARRLLPALLLMLFAVAIYTDLFASPQILHQIRTGGLATLGYVANWNAILSTQGYFGQATLPSPLLHTWSLAIEEQFYWVWPLVLIVLLRWRKSIRPVLAVALIGAVASAVEMALLFDPGFDTSRLYYGTDTRAQTILVGAALALLLEMRARAPAPWVVRALGVLGGLAAVGFAWMVVAVNSNTEWMYRGGFLLFACLAALLIWSVVESPDSPIARILSLAPLRYIGMISYGLYLWHWPVDVLLDHGDTGLLGWHLLLIRLTVTLSIAIASFHLVEQPIRKGGLRNWRPSVLTPAAVAIVAVAILVGTVIPAQTIAASTLEVPSSAIRNHRSVSVLIVGDSTAYLLGQDWMSTVAPKYYGVHLVSRGILGCGLAVTGLVREKSVVLSDTIGGYLPTKCADWPQFWAAYVAQYNPDVVVLLDGSLETQDHYLNGHWTHLGNSDFDALETSDLQRAVAVLSSRGAKVLLFTSPYFDQGEQLNGTPWPEDDPARVNRFNSLISQVADSHPGTARVVDFGKTLSPGGHYTDSIDGILVRDEYGVHETAAGADLVIPKVFPELVTLGLSRPTAP